MDKSNLRLKPHQIERVGRLKVMLVEQEIRLGIVTKFSVETSAKFSGETSAELFFIAIDFEYRAIYAAA